MIYFFPSVRVSALMMVQRPRCVCLEIKRINDKEVSIVLHCNTRRYGFLTVDVFGNSLSVIEDSMWC